MRRVKRRCPAHRMPAVYIISHIMVTGLLPPARLGSRDRYILEFAAAMSHRTSVLSAQSDNSPSHAILRQQFHLGTYSEHAGPPTRCQSSDRSIPYQAEASRNYCLPSANARRNARAPSAPFSSRIQKAHIMARRGRESSWKSVAGCGPEGCAGLHRKTRAPHPVQTGRPS
jgi:hypothetical protein